MLQDLVQSLGLGIFGSILVIILGLIALLIRVVARLLSGRGSEPPEDFTTK